MPINIIVTNAGRAAIVNAQNTGTAPVTIAQVGLSATAVTPLATATALAGELKRISAVAGEVVADDTIHISVTDDSADVYTLRSFALYLADGTLFAIYGQAAPLIEKVAASISALAIDVIFADIAAASLAFGNANFTNPPATTERMGVVELATHAEAQAGVDMLRALTPAAAKSAVLAWLLSQDGAGSGLDADLLDGKDWTGGQDVRFGTADVATPSAGTTGGLRLRGNQVSGFGYVQITNHNVTEQWGFWRYSVSGEADWYGSGGLRDNGSRVWSPANDGAGSGLDADLLDGQDGAFYTNITARLGYTPLNAASYTAADVRAKLLTVDGAGSGLDADLLDGRDWTSGQNVLFGIVEAQDPNVGSTGGFRLRGNPVNGFAHFQITNHDVTAQWGFWRHSVAGEADWYGGAGLRDNGSRVWSPANDGAGSGLDADLLDGRNASDFMLASDPATHGSNGNGYWVRHPNGVIEQWGRLTGTYPQGSYPITFPIGFTDPASVSIQLTAVNASGGTTSSFDFWTQIQSVSAGGCTLMIQDSGSAGAQGFHWRAIGK